jgi:hypothetical protein
MPYLGSAISTAERPPAATPNSRTCGPGQAPPGRPRARWHRRHAIAILNALRRLQQHVPRHIATDAFAGWGCVMVARRTANRLPLVMDADGRNTVQLIHNAVSERFPCWAPDGSQIIFTSVQDGDDDICLMSADGEHVVRLTHNPVVDTDPAWEYRHFKAAGTRSRGGAERPRWQGRGGRACGETTGGSAGFPTPVR